MSNYIISPDGKLYHTDDDYLQHWKYIRREKMANGKYRYYYETNNIDKVRVDRTYKSQFPQYDSYMVFRPETGGDVEFVSKEEYDSINTLPGLYVGNKKLSKLAREQISVGMSFVKDLLTGNVARKYKKKKKR